MVTICTVCGKPIEGSDVLYSLEGAAQCPACNAQDDLRRADLGAAANIGRAGYTALGLSLAGFLFDPFLLVTIGAISSGLYAFRSFRPDNERFSKHVAHRRTGILVCAGLGIGLTALRVAARVLVLMAG